MAVKIITKRQSMAEFISDAIAVSPKSQREIADEMGLDWIARTSSQCIKAAPLVFPPIAYTAWQSL